MQAQDQPLTKVRITHMERHLTHMACQVSEVMAHKQHVHLCLTILTSTIAGPYMPTPNANKAIVLPDSPDPIRIMKPGHIDEHIEKCKSPYKLGLSWPSISLQALNHFYEQLVVCPASEVNRYLAI